MWTSKRISEGTPDSFYPYGFSQGSTNRYISDTTSPTVNGVYVDGVSITLGNPRKHVWTYAVGLSESVNRENSNCPCTKGSKETVPAFVGNNYYCESGNPSGINNSMLYTDDVLWDGRQCPNDDSCCDKTGQPWFFHQLPISEDQHLEVRICQDQPNDDEAITVESLQLFVQ